MKILGVVLLMLFVSIHMNGQKYYITNLYMYDMFLMNPAHAGNEKACYSFSAFYQNKWLGTENSPTTQMINFQGSVGKNLGIGSYIYNDRNGNMKELGAQLATSYRIILNKTRQNINMLSFGLAFSFEQSSIDQSNFNNYSSLLDDPVINGGITSGSGINASSGLLLEVNAYKFGFSVTNMLNESNPIYLNDGEPDLSPDINFFASSLYKFSSRDVYLEPILMYRYNQNKDRKFDMTLKGTFPTPEPDYAFWGLVSFRRTMDKDFGKSLGLGATAGVNYQRISFGLEWQLGLTGAQIDYGSAYQVVLKYSICNSEKRKAIPCSAVQNEKKLRYLGLSW